MLIYPREGHSNPLQCSFLEKSMDRGAWWAIVHGVTKRWTWLNNSTCTDTHTHMFTYVLNFRPWNLSRMLQKSEWISFILLFVVSLNVFLILKIRKIYRYLKKFPPGLLLLSLGTEISSKSQNFNFNLEKTTNATLTRKARVLWRISVWSICPFSLFLRQQQEKWGEKDI